MANAEFKIKIGVDSGGVSAGVQRAVREFGQLVTSVRGFFAGFVVAKVVGEFKKVIDAAQKFSDVAQKIGTTTEFVQGLEYAAQKSGAEIHDMTNAFRKLAISQHAATRGNEIAQEAFARYGLTLERMSGMNQEQIFMHIAKAMGEIPASAQVAADAIILLGDSGDKVLPAFRNGLSDAMTELKDLGGVIEDDLSLKLNEFGDRLLLMGKKIVVALAPVVSFLIDVFDATTRAIQAVVTFYKVVARGGSLDDAGKAGRKVFADEAADDIRRIEQARGRRQKPNAAETAPARPTTRTERLEEGALSIMGADQQARRGIYFGGGGDVARIPMRTLDEIRNVRIRLERLVETNQQVARNGRETVEQLRRTNTALAEE